jgi:predicted dehydrogenase
VTGWHATAYNQSARTLPTQVSRAARNGRWVLIGSTDADTGLRRADAADAGGALRGRRARGSEDALDRARAIEALYAAAGERRSVTLST